MIHSIVVKFRLRMMVARKVILLKNIISPLMVMLFFSFVISVWGVIWPDTTGSILLRVVLAFNAEMVGPYISQLYWNPLESLDSC